MNTWKSRRVPAYHGAWRVMCLVACALTLASAAVLAVLASDAALPSWLRDPLAGFVQPGLAVWWLVLGGPFQSSPDAWAGMALAALTNSAAWLLLVWGVWLAVGAVRVRKD